MYGFQKHLSREFPSQITIDVTQFCNLACVHCPHSSFSKSESFSGANLDEGIHQKFIDEVATDGFGYCEYLRYTANGETLIHPKIGNILAYACKNSKTKVNVTTNGMLLDEKKIAMLIECGVNAVDISIDAFKEETYSKIRIKGVLSIVRNNVLNLIKTVQNHNSNLKVIVSFVEQPLNKNESVDFRNFWEENGAYYVVIRKLHSAGGIKKQIKGDMQENFKDIQRKPCLYPWERLVLMSTGEVGYCPADWAHQGVLGDLRTMTIKEIWQGEAMEKLREAHLKNDFSHHSFCGQCPDWVYTKWPFECGKNYADMMRKI